MSLSLLPIHVINLAFTAHHDLLWVALVIACLFRVWRARGVLAVLWTLPVFPAVIALNDVIKEAIARPRPDVAFALVTETGFAFPSTHAAVAGIMVVMMMGGMRVRNRWGTRAYCSVVGGLVVVLAFSRVWLGVHYATDVLAGLALGMVMGGVWVWVIDKQASLKYTRSKP